MPSHVLGRHSWPLRVDSRVSAGLAAGEPFDAIVLSTGMLVIRDWLTTYDERRDRLRHLVGANREPRL